jgi:hypothetical protein
MSRHPWRPPVQNLRRRAGFPGFESANGAAMDSPPQSFQTTALDAAAAKLLQIK